MREESVDLEFYKILQAIEKEKYEEINNSHDVEIQAALCQVVEGIDFLMLLLLCCATWEVKPHIGFKAKRYFTPEKRDQFYNSRSPTSTTDDIWQNHPSRITRF